MSEQLTLASLFDGSGGFPLAGILSNIRPIWASEVALFPIRVTTKRLPYMKHYGNVSKINGAEVEPVDIITFGSPCQDLSLAGKRSGLEGERSGLFFEAVRIIKEMRDATNGRKPRYIVWENVYGAFSSNNGKDFQQVITEIAQIKHPDFITPGCEEWESSGEILADDFSIAWRGLDAQFWGVPQRRKRIFLVADFNGQGASKILFESEGLSRYSAESFRAWQRITGNIGKGTSETNGRLMPFVKTTRAKSSEEISNFENLEVANTLNVFDIGETRCNEYVVDTLGISAEKNDTKSYGCDWYNGTVDNAASTLMAKYDSRTGNNGVMVLNDQGGEIMSVTEDVTISYGCDGYNGTIDDVASTLGANCGISTGRNGVIVLNDQGGEIMSVTEDVTATLRSQMGGHPPLVMDPLVIENHPADSRISLADDGKVQALTERMGTGGGNVPLIGIPYTLKIRCSKEGGGKGALIQENQSATLSCGNDQTLFVMATTQPNAEITENLSPTITAAAGMSGNNVPILIADARNGTLDDTAPSMQAAYDHTNNAGGLVMQAYGILRQVEGVQIDENKSPTIMAASGTSGNNKPSVAYSISSKDSNGFKSDNPKVGIYETEIAKTLDATGGNPNCNQGGTMIVSVDMGAGKSSCSIDENIAPTLATTHDGAPVIAFENERPIMAAGFCAEEGATTRSIGYSEELSPTLRAGVINTAVALEGNGTRPSHLESGFNEDDTMFTLNSTEVHNVAYGIGRDAFNQGAVETDVQSPITARGPGAMSLSKNSHFTSSSDEIADTLVATDYKDPPAVRFYPQRQAECMAPAIDKSVTLVNGTCPGFQNGVVDGEYIVRRLLPTECARLQGFPDWWCADLDNDEMGLDFWRNAFDEWSEISGSKKKSDKEILKWLKKPYSEAEEYKMWGNGVALPCVFFVLAGIDAWNDGKLKEDDDDLPLLQFFKELEL